MRKSLVILAAAIVIFCMNLTAAAQLSGALRDSLGPGAYTVVGDIYVNSGESLHLNPGTTFLFESGVQFDIRGYLYAVGTAEDSVIFKSRIAGQTWYGLDFSDSASDSCYLDYCVITGSHSSGLDIIRCSPTISNCLIIGNTGNNGGGIYCSYSNSVLSYCVISDNASNSNGGGIYLDHSDLYISNCVVRNDSSANGGGIYGEYSDPTLIYCSIMRNLGNMGGGMHFANESHPVITNCVVKHNASNICGAGLWSVSATTHITISNCLFLGNSAGGSAGAIYCYSTSAEISDCDIIRNASVSSGGAVFCRNPAPKIIRNCTFTDNLSEHTGGAIAVLNSNPVIMDCRLEGNFSPYNGGAIDFYASDSSRVIDCVITSNASQNGGGIAVYSSVPTFIGCLISYNSAQIMGGGISVNNSENPVFRNCTIARNSSYGGAGIHCRGSALTVENSIIFGNEGNGGIYFEDNYTISISYSDFYDNLRGSFTGSPPPNLGQLNSVNARGDSCDNYFNIFLNPRFNSTAGDSGFRLTLNSPCIDAGDPSSPFDPDSTVSDMGAFYFRHGFFITLTPHNPPVYIPAGGGSFTFDILIENISRNPLSGDFWTEALLPGGSRYGPLLQINNLTFPPRFRFEREVTQYVPGSAPSGEYTYYAVIRSSPDSIIYQDSLSFVKIPGESHYQDDEQGWAVYGWEDDYSSLNSPPAAASFELMPAHPNPFNNETILIYQVAEPGLVNLTIYDNRGRQVEVIAAGYHQAGTYNGEFDGGGRSSGIYFACLTAKDYRQTRKLVLVK